MSLLVHNVRLKSVKLRKDNKWQEKCVLARVLMLESTTRETQKTSNDSTSIEQTSLFYRPIVPQVPNMQSLPCFPTAMCILCCVF